MIGLDIDGTLLDYGAGADRAPQVNHALIRELAEQGIRSVALISNQGGLPYGVMGVIARDGSPFPRPVDFAARLWALSDALANAGIDVASVQVCVYHAKAPGSAIVLAKDEVEQLLVGWPRLVVYADPAYRKPAPLMLVVAGCSRYYGDSDEDQQAAERAGCAFVRVPRFTGT